MSWAWSREDFPREVLCSHMDHDSFLCDEMREMLAERLNAHHPKPDPGAMSENYTPEGVDIVMRNLADARRERDAAVERAEQAEREVDTWRTSTESAHSDFLQAAHDRDEARARLREVRSIAAVSHDEVKQAMQGQWGGSFDAILAAVWALVSGTDPAVYVVRESHITAVEVERDSHDEWFADGEHVYVDDARQANHLANDYMTKAVRRFAVSRAIEAEQAADPIEAEVAMAWAEYRKDYQPNPDDLTAAHKAFTSGYLAARHVLGQEASSDE